MSKTIDWIVWEVADKVAIIKEKDKKIVELTAIEKELSLRVEKLKKDTEQLTRDNIIMDNKTKAQNERSLNDLNKTRESIWIELENIKKERESIAKERISIAKEKEKVWILLWKNTTSLEKSKQLDAEITSKKTEIKRLWKARKEEIQILEDKRKEIDNLIRQNKKLEINIEKISKENKKVLTSIKKAQSDAETTQDNLQKERLELEQLRQNAITENNSAEYNKNIAKTLQITFRQALHTYIQYNWTEIKLLEITDEDKKFIAKTLLDEIKPNE